MSETAEFTGNPNSAHQMWSRWRFGIEANPRKLPRKADVLDNARRYFAEGFKSDAGRVSCHLLRTPADAVLLRRATYYLVQIEIEGPPVHDPAYRDAVLRDFAARFVAPGFGSGARLVLFTADLLAGDKQDGTPPEQLIVLPTLAVTGPPSFR